MANAVRITYDPEGDILYVTFGPPAPSTGYQLSDQLLLRVHPDSRLATGLTVLNFSVHARSSAPIPLTELKTGATPEEVVRILRSAPVNRFIRIAEDPTGLHAFILQPPLDEAVAA